MATTGRIYTEIRKSKEQSSSVVAQIIANALVDHFSLTCIEMAENILTSVLIQMKKSKE